MSLLLEEQGKALILPVTAPASAQLPSYQSSEAAGADVKAFLQAPLPLEPGQRALIPTGVRVQLPKGYEIQVRPRSGLAAKHGVTVLNSPGTIDSDYRGEIKILLINLGQEPFTVLPGMRIAQLVVAPVVRAEWHLTAQLEETERGTSGFGGTGF